MRKPSYWWAVVPILTLYACQPSHYRGEADSYQTAADSTAADALFSPLDSAPRIRIKQADVRCRVNDVFAVTTAMERTVRHVGGVVTESTLRTELNATHDQPWTGDSIRRVRRSTPQASLLLRVPVQHLDSVVHTLTSMAAFVEFRQLQDKDATLAYKRNKLKNDAAQETNRQTSHTKMNRELEVNTYREAKTNEQIDRQIENLSMLDNAAYCTVSVALYQPEIVEVQILPDPEHSPKPAFMAAAGDALSGGADVLRGLALLILKVWPMWLMLGAGWWAYKKLGVFRR
ncbi:DUF4349 domain-containing protein [Chitinophaga lutea]